MKLHFRPASRRIPADWPQLIVRLGLGALFIWAGSVKIADPRAFARIIDGYGLAPEPLLAPLAIAIPVLELLAGVGLIFDLPGSIQLTFALLAVFTAALGYGVASGLDIDCGCLSAEEIRGREGLGIALLRDVGLLAAVGWLFYRKRAKNGPASPESSPSKRSSAAGSVLDLTNEAKAP